MHPRAYDRSEDWYVRLRGLIRVLRLARDLARSVCFVALGALLGGVAGAWIGAGWNTDFSFWAGMAAGAAVGSAAGIAGARRLFFHAPRATQEPAPPEPTPGAPRWPGVEEQFRKILFRLRILCIFLMPPLRDRTA